MSGKSRPWAASRAVYITPVMRTRSPALSDSTSASVSGVVMSLMPSGAVVTISSQRHLFVAVRVAFDSVAGGLDGPLHSLPQNQLRQHQLHSNQLHYNVTLLGR